MSFCFLLATSILTLSDFISNCFFGWDIRGFNNRLREISVLFRRNGPLFDVHYNLCNNFRHFIGLSCFYFGLLLLILMLLKRRVRIVLNCTSNEPILVRFDGRPIGLNFALLYLFRLHDLLFLHEISFPITNVRRTFRRLILIFLYRREPMLRSYGRVNVRCVVTSVIRKALTWSLPILTTVMMPM